MTLLKMKVENMESSRGNTVPNQFVIKSAPYTFFQSYTTVIASIMKGYDQTEITLDQDSWDYSRTTLKYLAEFLRHQTGEAINGKADIEKKIKDGSYKLADLN